MTTRLAPRTRSPGAVPASAAAKQGIAAAPGAKAAASPGNGHKISCGLEEAIKYAKRSKYGAVRTTVDGITFASRAEAKRYGELKLLANTGQITDLVLQPRYPLYVSGKEIGEYVADFRYRNHHGFVVVEDVKGVSTDLYRWKRRHVEAQYGIKIVEIRSR